MLLVFLRLTFAVFGVLICSCNGRRVQVPSEEVRGRRRGDREELPSTAWQAGLRSLDRRSPLSRTSRRSPSVTLDDDEAAEVSVEDAPVGGDDEELKVGQHVVGYVTGTTKFGVFVEIGEVKEALLHISQMGPEFVSDVTEKYNVGDDFDGWVRSVDRQNQKFGLTLRPPGTEPPGEYADDPNRTPLKDLEVGQEVSGKVKVVLGYGAFVDVGAQKDALIHVSNFENYVNPKEIFKVGDEIKARVDGIQFDPPLLKLKVNEGDFVEVEDKSGKRPLEEFKPGQEVTGDVKFVASYGAFVDVGGVERALLHVKEIPGFVEDTKEQLPIGTTVKGWIKDIDLRNKQMWMTQIDPIGKAIRTLEELEVGEEVIGTVYKKLDFGVLLDIGAEKGGLLHVAELDKWVDDIEAAFKIGEELTVQIKDIDLERRRIGFSARTGTSGEENEVPEHSDGQEIN